MKLKNKINITLASFLLLFATINANNIKNTDPEKDKILVYVLKTF